MSDQHPEAASLASWPDGVPGRLTDGQLDQWEASARADAEAGNAWSVNPLAVLSVVRELRMYREWIVSGEAGPTFDDQAPTLADRRAAIAERGLREAGLLDD